MFERYTEKARRVIFFARYEASQFGSEVIDSEHLLLGILRETHHIARMLPAGAVESIRNQIEARAQNRPRIGTSVDLPLSNAGQRILAYGAEEAERLNHRHIGSAHLFLGLFREKGCVAAELLESYGLKLEEVRKRVENSRPDEEVRGHLFGSLRGMATPARSTITIHGSVFPVAEIREAVKRLRSHNWLWQRTTWKPRDCVVDLQSAKVSFDLSLANDATHFRLVEAGWKKDRCAVCRWELTESADDHGTGYTNGRDWICLECYERFWQRPDFISGSYSEIT